MNYIRFIRLKNFPDRLLANHESVAGGIVGAAGALLAAWFAWHAITAQIDSIRPPSWLRSNYRTIARNADRAYVTGGPGARMIDENNNHIGIISTGMNTGTTPAFPKEVYWGICKKDDWPDVGKDWPLRQRSMQFGRKYCRPKWTLPTAIPSSAPRLSHRVHRRADSRRWQRLRVLRHHRLYHCVRRHVATSWKHSVTRVQMLRDGKVLKGLKTDALPGGYSSEWAEPKKSAAGEPKAQREWPAAHAEKAPILGTLAHHRRPEQRKPSAQSQLGGQGCSTAPTFARPPICARPNRGPSTCRSNLATPNSTPSCRPLGRCRLICAIRFCRPLHMRLAGRDVIGPGVVHQVVRELQRQFFDPPDLSHAGGGSKYR